jgi:GDPmannose 4,6-dehydratase
MRRGGEGTTKARPATGRRDGDALPRLPGVVAAARRALITGVDGQDGSYLAEQLVAEGCAVTGMVRDKSRAESANLASVRDALSIVVGDLLDPVSLRSALATARPDELYHLAAPTFVPDSWDDPTETVAAIATGTAALLAAARAENPAIRVWVATSSEIFGDAGESPQNERSPMRPRTPYGVAKLAAHGLVGAMRAHHGMFVCSGITYNHESPRRPPQFLPRKVTRAVAAISLGLQDSLELGDLDAVRDWSHAADVVAAARLALRHGDPGDYVVASGVGRTVRNLVEAAFAHVGLQPDRYVVVDSALVRRPEPTAPVGDPSRARSVLAWRPQHSFEALVAEMVDADLADLTDG